MTKPYAELEKLRTDLWKKVSKGDLKWTQFPLRDDPKQEHKDAPYTIEVCGVVSKEGYYLPISADDLFAKAATWGIFPLSSAVMDQMVYGSNYVPRKHMDSNKEIRDFEKYSKYLHSTLYSSGGVIMGAHKCWVISGKGRRINHGFYLKRRPSGASLTYLPSGWDAIQKVGAHHETDAPFWDYSQLAQFMRNFKTKDGKTLNLREALQNRHPAVWDKLFEPKGPTRLP